jgi:acetyl-CoA carboxylase beta subunit
MNPDRFSPRTAAEDIAAEWPDCESCGERTHHEELDDEGLCKNCRNEDE